MYLFVVNVSLSDKKLSKKVQYHVQLFTLKIKFMQTNWFTDGLPNAPNSDKDDIY